MTATLGLHHHREIPFPYHTSRLDGRGDARAKVGRLRRDRRHHHPVTTTTTAAATTGMVLALVGPMLQIAVDAGLEYGCAFDRALIVLPVVVVDIVYCARWRSCEMAKLWGYRVQRASERVQQASERVSEPVSARVSRCGAWCVVRGAWCVGGGMWDMGSLSVRYEVWGGVGWCVCVGG